MWEERCEQAEQATASKKIKLVFYFTIPASIPFCDSFRLVRIGRTFGRLVVSWAGSRKYNSIKKKQ